MSTPKCRIIGCSRPRAYPNGTCKLHNGRWYKAGRPDLDVWDGIVPHDVRPARAAEACVICNASMLDRPTDALTCGAAECSRERARRNSREAARRARKARTHPARGEDGQIDWPVVIQRIERSMGAESAALALDSLNRTRRAKGHPEVRL